MQVLNFQNINNFKVLMFLFAVTCILLYLYKNELNIQKRSTDRLILETELDSLSNDSIRDTFMEVAPHKFVVISSNVDPGYMFNVPLVSLAWRRVGYEPIILIVYSNTTQFNLLVNKTIEFLDKFKIKYLFIKSPPDYDVMVGMLSRLFIGLLPESMLASNDFILTSDSDLFPINRDYYNFENTYEIRAWNAYCCGKFIYENDQYTMFPLSHIGMRKFQWNEVMGINSTHYKLNGESILNKIGELFNKTNYIKKNNEINKGDCK